MQLKFLSVINDSINTKLVWPPRGEVKIKNKGYVIFKK